MDLAALRDRMVDEQIIGRGISDPRVIAVMRRLERHRFVPGERAEDAYADSPVGISRNQTVSQPYMVALMTQSLRLSGREKVLEIGTGSGYQTAVLSLLAAEVCTIERFHDLSEAAATLLETLGCANVRFAARDGSVGWKEEAPYDRIIITAACPRIPFPLVEQLKEGGSVVAPVGEPGRQMLCRGIKENGSLRLEDICECVFVPLVGEFGMVKKDRQ